MVQWLSMARITWKYWFWYSVKVFWGALSLYIVSRRKRILSKFMYSLCISCVFLWHQKCNDIWYNMYKKQKLRDLSLPVHLLWSEQYLNNIAVPLLLECTGTLQDAWKYKCQKITNQLKRYIPTSIDVKMSIKKRF